MSEKVENIYICIFGNLADALVQSDLWEQLGLSALLEGTSADFSPGRLGDWNRRPLGCWRGAIDH